MSDLTQLQTIIDGAFELRAELGPHNLPRELAAALEDCLALLDEGPVLELLSANARDLAARWLFWRTACFVGKSVSSK